MINFTATPALAGQRWKCEYQEGCYRVRSEVAAGQVAPAVRGLADLQMSLTETLKIRLSEQPIQLIIFSSVSSYRSYIRPRIPEAVNRPALFVKGPDALWVYVVFRNGWETDLRHEVTHAHLHGSLPYLPMWLDEGLAKYFEVPTAQAGYQRDYHSHLVWRLRFRQSLRTRELEAMRDLNDMRPEHYRDSWAWVYYGLNSSAQSRALLQRYLQTIQAEEVAGSYFTYLETAIPQAQEQAQEFFRRLK